MKLLSPLNFVFVLLLTSPDVWHPDLSDEEVHLLKFVTNAQVKASQKLASAAKLHQQQERERERESERQLAQSVTAATDTHTNTTSEKADMSEREGESDFQDFFSVIDRASAEGISPAEVRKIWGEDEREV
jgi:hypothetical protein